VKHHGIDYMLDDVLPGKRNNIVVMMSEIIKGEPLEKQEALFEIIRVIVKYI